MILIWASNPIRTSSFATLTFPYRHMEVQYGMLWFGFSTWHMEGQEAPRTESCLQDNLMELYPFTNALKYVNV